MAQEDSRPLYVGNQDVALELQALAGRLTLAGETLYTEITNWIEAYERLQADQTLGQRRQHYENRARLVENITRDLHAEIGRLVNEILS